MTKSKWSIGTRNKLAEMEVECDSCAAISSLTSKEREELQALIKKAREYMDKKLFNF